MSVLSAQAQAMARDTREALLVAMSWCRLNGLRYRISENLPGKTPTDFWGIEATMSGEVVIYGRRFGRSSIEPRPWQIAHELAHAIHPESMGSDPDDSRAEALGDFHVTERRIARALGCERCTMEVQKDNLRRALREGRLTDEEARAVRARLRRL